MASQYSRDVEEIATRVMYELTGRRWVWPAITTIEEIDLPVGQQFVVLHGRPVISIESVTSSLEPNVQIPYKLFNGMRVEFDTPNAINTGPWNTPFAWQPGCGTGRQITVKYKYGSPPPLEILYAIEVLSKELTLSMNGDDECRLPDKVTSVNRNGISMQMLSAQDFLDNGRTGITEVDSAIRNANSSGAKRPARVYSMTTPPARRTGTTQAPS